MKRPEGWDEVRDLFIKANGGGYAEKIAALEDFEAGADAYAEALKKGGVYKSGVDREWHTEKFRRQRGWVVFIPEEIEL